MNVVVGDVLNQGRFAIYVSNISEEGILIQGNNLWVPPAGPPGSAAEIREPRERHGRRTRRLELRRAVRRPQQRRPPRPLPGQRLRLGVAARTATGTTSRRSPAAISGHLRRQELAADGRPSLSGYQQKKVWINDGAGRFIDVAQMVGVTDRFDGRAVALADLRNRGVLDVVVANQRGPLLLYRNEVAPGRAGSGSSLKGAAVPARPAVARTAAPSARR